MFGTVVAVDAAASAAVAAENDVSHNSQKFEAKELPLHGVTVFTDRAEVKRTFPVKLDAGLTDIVVENLTASADADSVRVDGRGPVVIHEVQHKNVHVVKEEVDSPKVKELREQLKELKGKKAEIEARGRAYEKRLLAVNQLVDKIGKNPAKKDDSASDVLHFDVNLGESLDKLFDYHLERSVQFEAEIRTAHNEAVELEEKMNKIGREIDESKFRPHVPMKRNVVITVEAPEACDAELDLSYQVHQAYWQPSYDIRVLANADKPSMKICYFGNIHQNSGEDWRDVALTLSTAQPRLGGSLPQIGTLKARLHKDEPPTYPEVQTFGGPPSGGALFGAAAPQRTCQKRMAAAPCAGFAGGAEVMQMARREALHSTMESQQHVLSTTFTVPQKKSIPSDNSDHKVTITVLEFEPLFRYDCIPSKNTNVFLTASVINDSDYPLLAGSASVYMDGSFSNKMHIKAVSVGDKFDCPIGVDPTVKVDYKLAHIFHQQAGMINKSSVTVREQKIVVKNTKQNQLVLLTVVEQVPKATDEKIRVKLNHPEVKSVSVAPSSASNSSGRPSIGSIADLKPRLEAPEVGVKLNDANNLEWTILLGANKEKDLVVKWTAEVPAAETLEFREDF